MSQRLCERRQAQADISLFFNGGMLCHKGFLDSTGKRRGAQELAEAMLPGPMPYWKRTRWAKTSRPLRENAPFSTLVLLGSGPLKGGL